MIYNTAAGGISQDAQAEAPVEALSSPALLFLYYRVEQILGIKAGSEALKNLNEYLENACGASFVENPAAYERLLASREQIYVISKFLTIKETYFFREGVHFELLTSLLPELAKLRRPVHICSAAVSVGCEAYSIAMLLDYHKKKGLDIDFTLDAFDVNAEAIEIAKNARYTANALRVDGSAWKHILDSYLIPDNGEYIVAQEIRGKVSFFPHNIMRGIEKKYDVIFFRNALIYFSFNNRLVVFNNLVESLYNNGYLFLGISETASANHPLLANRHSCDAFYFQKRTGSRFPEQLDAKQKAENKPNTGAEEPFKDERPKPQHEVNKTAFHVSCKEISSILKAEDGKPNAEHVLYTLENEKVNSLSGGRLAAAIIYFLNIQKFDPADKVLSHLEKLSSCSIARFLRGEYHFLSGKTEEAEKYYQEAAVKDKSFWPAFYRIAVLACEGNRTRYEYKIKKTTESIELSKNQQPDEESYYECFMGGFSPDYFLRILEKKLT